MSLKSAIGQALRRVRAGDTHLAERHPALVGTGDTLDLRSDWFAQGAAMPQRSAGPGVGQNVSPPLAWAGPPQGTRSLAVLIEDPDVPLPRPLTHLIAYGLAADARRVEAGGLNAGAELGFGLSFNGAPGYAGPRALPGHGPHRYIFHILALSKPLRFDRPPRLPAFLAAAQGAVLARGRLVGTFEQH